MSSVGLVFYDNSVAFFIPAVISDRVFRDYNYGTGFMSALF